MDVPYEVRVRKVHGYRRAYVCMGSGPALLLIHGIGNDLHTWRPLIPELAKSYTVIAPDLLGHGKSDKPRADYSVAAYANGMRDLLAVLDVDRVTVVGHSLGGGVATQFAYQYPDRCERLVLISSGGVARSVHPALRLATAPGAAQFLSLMQLKGVQLTVRLAFGLLAKLDADTALDRDVVLPMLFDSLRDPTSRQAFVRTLRAVVDLRGQCVTMLDRCYLTAGMPTLLIWGSRDSTIPLEHGRIAHAAMPGSELEVFDGAGHFPHLQFPERVLEVLTDFLENTEPQTFSPQQWRVLLRAGRRGVERKLGETAKSVRPMLRSVEG